MFVWKTSIRVANKKTVRHKMLNGIKYVIANVTLMVPGVHEGSEGKIFYNETELEKWTPSWNHKPIVVRHPVKESGEYDSASNEAVMETQFIGFLMNAQWSDGKQWAEAWIDEKLAEKHSPGLIARINSGEKIEVSTGLVANSLEESGTWNGEDYDAVAIDHRPDHLAVLPDSKGACSCKDGCGIHNKQKVSHRDCERQIQTELSNRFGQPGKSWPGMVHAIYEDMVVYETYDDGYKFYSLPYTIKNGKVKLAKGDPTQVEITYDFKAVNGGIRKVLNNGKLGPVRELPTPKETAMPFDRNKAMKVLIGNGKPFSEKDRKTVEAFDEKTLRRMAKAVRLANQSAKADEKPVRKGPKIVIREKVKDSPKDKIKSLDTLLANASPELAETVTEMVKSSVAAKNEYIKVIANATKADEKALAKLDLATLKTMAKSYEAPADNSLDSLMNNFHAQVGTGFVVNADAKIPSLARPDKKDVIEKMRAVSGMKA